MIGAIHSEYIRATYRESMYSINYKKKHIRHYTYTSEITNVKVQNT
jgi:hypothetical protein